MSFVVLVQRFITGAVVPSGRTVSSTPPASPVTPEKSSMGARLRRTVRACYVTSSGPFLGRCLVLVEPFIRRS